MIRPMRQTRKRARSRSRSSHPDEGGSQRRRVRRKRTTCFDEGAEALRRPVFLVFIVNARQRSYLDSHPKPPGHGPTWHGSAHNACWQLACRGFGLLLSWWQIGSTCEVCQICRRRLSFLPFSARDMVGQGQLVAAGALSV